jgi:hypothetical protein
MLTPATVHFDRVEQSPALRRAALALAFNKNPVRAITPLSICQSLANRSVSGPSDDSWVVEINT